MWPIFCPEVDDSVGSSQDFPCKTHEDESQKFLPLSRILSIPGILGLAKFEPQSNYSFLYVAFRLRSIPCNAKHVLYVC